MIINFKNITILLLAAACSVSFADEKDKQTENERISLKYKLKAEVSSAPNPDKKIKQNKDNLNNMIEYLNNLKLEESSSSESSSNSDSGNTQSNTKKDGDSDSLNSAVLDEISKTAKGDKVSKTDDSSSKNKNTTGDKDAEPNNKPLNIKDLSKGDIESIIQSLTDEKQKILLPAEVAHSLYLDGKFEQAGKFYKLALDNLDEKSAGYHTKRAWYLFQAGNSYRYCNYILAMEFYSKLIESYPNSPWTPIAKEDFEMAYLLDNEKPKNLIREFEELANEQ